MQLHHDVKRYAMAAEFRAHSLCQCIILSYNWKTGGTRRKEVKRKCACQGSINSSSLACRGFESAPPPLLPAAPSSHRVASQPLPSTIPTHQKSVLYTPNLIFFILISAHPLKSTHLVQLCSTLLCVSLYVQVRLSRAQMEGRPRVGPSPSH